MEPSSGHLTRPLARRVVVRAGSLVPLGLGVAVLAACGGEDSSGQGDATSQEESSTQDESTSDGSGQSGQQGGGSAMSTADVPVEGATYDKASNTIYAQPAEGDFVAYDATCPHQGCSVSEFVDAELECPCHGSRFDPATGDVVSGPATRGLSRKKVTVEGDELVVG
ncbi:MAG: Rieske (2Fe-2S) protein [Ornithinimicrobium sp.]